MGALDGRCVRVRWTRESALTGGGQPGAAVRGHDHRGCVSGISLVLLHVGLNRASRLWGSACCLDHSPLSLFLKSNVSLMRTDMALLHALASGPDMAQVFGAFVRLPPLPSLTLLQSGTTRVHQHHSPIL
jgi:hypothetical protein